MIKSRARSMKAVAAVAIGFLIAGVSVSAASASTPTLRPGPAPLCVPSASQEYVAPTYEEQVVTEAGWQRYSWTGGPWESDDAPAFPGDDGDWQANTASDPHGIGVEGAYYVSHGGSGNGDWFYLEATPEETEMVETDPGQPYVEAVYCQIGLYIYPKLNSAAPAGWTNSGPQTFIADKNGVAPTDWYTNIGQLPAGVCGDGWGYQQDATKSSSPVDLAGAVIEYPNTTIPWPPIYAAKHGELSDLIPVPDCPPVLTEVTPAAATAAPICGPDNDTVTIPTTEGVTYSDTGWVGGERTITATADEGYVLAEGKSSWTFTDEATICPIEITGVSVTVADPPICGPNNDSVDIPVVEGLTFSDTGWVGGERTIKATADEGYVLEGETSWTFTDVPVANCPDEPPVFSYTPTGELAFTGASTGTNGLTALAIFLMTAGTALVALRTRTAK